MRILLVSILAVLAGCTGADARREYYLAVQQTAQAQARAAEARYDSLARMSASGTAESQAAAVMALALYNPVIAQPSYVEDPALKWASVLAGPIAAVSSVWINSQQAVDLAKINAGTQRVAISTQADSQQAAYAAIAQGGGNLVSTANGLIELTRDSLNLVDSTVGQSYEFATTNGEQAYNFSTEALTQSYQFSGDVFGTTVEWAEFVQSNYQPVIVPPLVIQPVEITPIIVPPSTVTP